MVGAGARSDGMYKWVHDRVSARSDDAGGYFQRKNPVHIIFLYVAW